MIAPQADYISIVGGGWSVSEVDPLTIPGTIIAVNDACVKLPRYDIALSMDRLWTEQRWPFLHMQRKPAYLRRNALQNIDHKGFPWAHLFDCDYKGAVFSENIQQLNGTNSGLCACNLAYIMRPRQLFLFGFDMQRGPSGEPYWYEPYPWRPDGGTTPGKYIEWSRGFEDAAAMFKAQGCEVVNVSSRTLIKSFPRVVPALLNMARNAE